MSKSIYTTALNNKVTPQNTPIPGKEAVMAKNNAGGFTFTVDPFVMLERFLILGSDSPTYYVGAQQQTAENATNLRTCLKLDGKRAVDVIVDISMKGRAPKNDPAVFALAIAATPAYSSPETAIYALENLSKVCRIGTHLFQFVEIINGTRGWGRALKREVGKWYTEKDPNQLAYQLIKYQQRNGWSHKNVIQLAHPVPSSEETKALLAYAAQQQSYSAVEEAAKSFGEGSKKASESQIKIRRERYTNALKVLYKQKLVAAFENAKYAKTEDEIVKLIQEAGLTREMIPTNWLNSVAVWEALLVKMPIGAMVRNLGKMTSIGLLKPLSSASKLVTSALNNQEFIKKSRLHPMSILLASGVYAQGHGDKGSLSWSPVPTIVDALDKAFYLAFDNVVPTGKNRYIAVDVSGSMSSSYAGTGVSCALAAAALALITAKTEANYAIYGFASGGTAESMWGDSRYSPKMVDLNISAADSVKDVCAKMGKMTMGGTNCALPMLHAIEQKLDVDSFEIYTDNETWQGKIHASQALNEYRKFSGKPDVRLIVNAMTPTKFSIADPKDQYSLDVVGFDASAPAVMADFIRGYSANASEVDE